MIYFVVIREPILYLPSHKIRYFNKTLKVAINKQRVIVNKRRSNVNRKLTGVTKFEIFE